MELKKLICTLDYLDNFTPNMEIWLGLSPNIFFAKPNL